MVLFSPVAQPILLRTEAGRGHHVLPIEGGGEKASFLLPCDHIGVRYSWPALPLSDCQGWLTHVSTNRISPTVHAAQERSRDHFP